MQYLWFIVICCHYAQHAKIKNKINYSPTVFMMSNMVLADPLAIATEVKWGMALPRENDPIITEKNTWNMYTQMLQDLLFKKI